MSVNPVWYEASRNIRSQSQALTPSSRVVLSQVHYAPVSSVNPVWPSSRVVLSQVHYARDEPVHMTYIRPHITTNSLGRITSFTWSPPFEGPLPSATRTVDARAYYTAYAALVALMESEKDLLVRFRLKPGRTVSKLPNKPQFGQNYKMLRARTVSDLPNKPQFGGNIFSLKLCEVDLLDLLGVLRVR